MFKRIILISLAIIFCTPHAIAQEREYQAGMQQTTIYKQPKRPAQPQKPYVSKPDINTPETAKEEKLSAAQRIWNKYKDLASGTAENKTEAKETKNAHPPPEVEEVKEASKQENEPAPSQEPEKKKSGLTNLLQQYQENKNNQRQMHTRRFKTPAQAPAQTPTSTSPTNGF